MNHKINTSDATALALAFNRKFWRQTAYGKQRMTQWHLEYSAPSLPSSGRLPFSHDTLANSYGFYCLKASVWLHCSPFFLVCILNPTFCSKLSWIPDRNSLRTWNNLGWTSGDHLLQPFAWVLTTTLLLCLEITALLWYTLHQALYAEKLLGATGSSEAA